MFKVGKKYFLNVEDYEDRSYEVNPKDLISQELRELLSSLPKDESSHYTILGKESYNNLEYGNAIENFTNAIELNRNNIIALFFRGLCFTSMEKYHDAINDFTKIIELQPSSLQAFFYRGNAQLLLETYDQLKSAIKDYTSVIKKNPGDGIAYFLRGYCYLLLKQDDQANMDWREAKKLNVAKQDEEKWKEDYVSAK